MRRISIKNILSPRRRAFPIATAYAVSGRANQIKKSYYRPQGVAKNILSQQLVAARLTGSDNRLYHPAYTRPALTVRGRIAPITLKQKRGTTSLKMAKLSFAVPSQTAVCIRRTMRRQVIFAKNKNGGGHRAPRRNSYSNIRC
jgi:hypothetical protein